MAAPLETGQTGVSESKSDFSKLSALDGVDSVLIKQPVRSGELLCEMCCGCEMQNLYTIQTANPQTRTVTQLFTMKEDSNCCLRQWYTVYYDLFIFHSLWLFYK